MPVEPCVGQPPRDRNFNHRVPPFWIGRVAPHLGLTRTVPRRTFLVKSSLAGDNRSILEQPLIGRLLQITRTNSERPTASHATYSRPSARHAARKRAARCQSRSRGGHSPSQPAPSSSRPSVVSASVPSGSRIRTETASPRSSTPSSVTGPTKWPWTVIRLLIGALRAAASRVGEDIASYRPDKRTVPEPRVAAGLGPHDRRRPARRCRRPSPIRGRQRVTLIRTAFRRPPCRRPTPSHSVLRPAEARAAPTPSRKRKAPAQPTKPSPTLTPSTLNVSTERGAVQGAGPDAQSLCEHCRAGPVTD
jgi:hypothetical protein